MCVSEREREGGREEGRKREREKRPVVDPFACTSNGLPSSILSIVPYGTAKNSERQRDRETDTQ